MRIKIRKVITGTILGTMLIPTTIAMASVTKGEEYAVEYQSFHSTSKLDNKVYLKLRK
ncbi:MAG: hypothetical protein ACRDDY_01075 [Clostridium sp.]|uniref:hypothetical protein n=1 Tax=Clostridium sp. TaxID=1506 RepID=UPI003EE6FB08